MTQALTTRSARRPGWGQTVRFILLLASVVLVLIPVYVLLVTSFKGSADADPSRTWYLPEVWVTKNWSNAWNQLSGGLLRSLALVIPSSIISAMLGSANGFVLSKWRFPGANVVFTLILFGMFIPYQAVMIPLMRLVTSADLGFGIHTLILMHVVYGIPITTLIFRNYYETIPHELIEAARVDGASEWQLYKSIIFPQLTPIALSAVIIIGHMSLKSFDLIMSITDQRTYSTKVPAIDMFNFMTDNDYSNAAAVGTILLVLVAVAVIPYLIHDAKGRR